RLSSIDKKLGSLVTRYRQAVHDGSALVLGRDVVEGHPVYWIRVDSEMLPDARKKLHKWAHDVAVSQKTFEPVAVREVRDGRTGPKGNSIVLEAESLPKDKGNFTRMPRASKRVPLKIGWSGFLTPPEGSILVLDAGIALMQKDGLYVALDASSEGVLLAAARALERVPASKGTAGSVLASRGLVATQAGWTQLARRVSSPAPGRPDRRALRTQLPWGGFAGH